MSGIGTPTNKHVSGVRVAVIPDDEETLVAHGG
jgi:hypothetical protein